MRACLEYFRSRAVVDRAAGLAQRGAPSDLVHERVAHLHRVDDRPAAAHNPTYARRPAAHALCLERLLLLCELCVQRLQELGGRARIDAGVIAGMLATRFRAAVRGVLPAVARTRAADQFCTQHCHETLTYTATTCCINKI